MPGLFDLFKKQSYERVRDEHPEMPPEDLFKLLSIFYTFNHGDKPCQPITLEYRFINKEEGSFDFATLNQKFHEVGYYIDKVVCVTDEPMSQEYVPFVPDEKEYEKRRKNEDYLPMDISYLIVSNLSGDQFIIQEDMESIEFLANGGDERAIKTYNSWLKYKNEINNYYSFCPKKEDDDDNEKVKKRN